MSTLASATREVVEGMLVFLGQHRDHLSRSAVKQLRPCLAVTVIAAARETPSGVDCTCNVKVSASGVGAYYLDAVLFLNTLCEHGEQLKTVVSAPQMRDSMQEKWCPLSLLCRKIGECANVLSYEVEGISAGKLQIRESLVPRPNDFPTAGMLGTIVIRVPREALSSEVHKLTSQLHLIHLINPTVCLSLSVTDEESSSSVCSVEYESELSRAITNTPFSLVTSLQHFLEPSSIPLRQSKLHMVRGTSYVIPEFPLGSGNSVSLKVYCTAAVVPHLPLRRGRKIPANKVCRTLNISVFGPCSLPLLQTATGGHLGFSLSELANWENYGFRIKQTALYTTSSSSIVSPSVSFEVTDVRTEVLFGRTRLDARHTLQLFIFLEAVRQPGNALRGATNQQWKQSMVLLHLLRGSFESLVRKHHKKFQQAIHSALNKVACNYGLHTKASSALGRAIPLISEAVASIVRHSSDSIFQEQCQELTQADGVSRIEGCVTQTLWKLAKDKLQMSHPSEPASHVPDEPTTPEVIVAVSEEETLLPRPRRRRERRKRTDSNLGGLAGSGRGNENGDQLKGLSDNTPTDISVSEDRESGFRELIRSPHGGWSLFQAKIASKRSDKMVSKTEDHFDSLAAVDKMEIAESQHSEFDTQLSVQDSGPLLQDFSSQVVCSYADHSSGRASPVSVHGAGSSHGGLEDSMLLTQESCEGNDSFDELASFEMASTQGSLDSEQETLMDRDECGAMPRGPGTGVKVSTGVVRPDDYSSDSEWDDVALWCGHRHPAVSGLQPQPEGPVPPNRGHTDHSRAVSSDEDTLCVHQNNRDSFDSLEGVSIASCDVLLTAQTIGSQPGSLLSPSLGTDCTDQNSDSGSSEWENCADDIEKEWAGAQESDCGSWDSASISLLPQRALQTSPTDGWGSNRVLRPTTAIGQTVSGRTVLDCGESLTQSVSENDFIWD